MYKWEWVYIEREYIEWVCFKCKSSVCILLNTLGIEWHQWYVGWHHLGQSCACTHSIYTVYLVTPVVCWVTPLGPIWCIHSPVIHSLKMHSRNVHSLNIRGILSNTSGMLSGCVLRECVLIECILGECMLSVYWVTSVVCWLTSIYPLSLNIHSEYTHSTYTPSTYAHHGISSDTSGLLRDTYSKNTLTPKTLTQYARAQSDNWSVKRIA